MRVPTEVHGGVYCREGGKGFRGGSQIRLVLSVRSARQGFTHLSTLMSSRMSLMSSTDRQRSSAQQSLTNTSLARSKFRGSRAYLFRSPKSLYCLRLATPEGIDLLQSSETVLFSVLNMTQMCLTFTEEGWYKGKLFHDKPLWMNKYSYNICDYLLYFISHFDPETHWVLYTDWMKRFLAF